MDAMRERLRPDGGAFGPAKRHDGFARQEQQLDKRGTHVACKDKEPRRGIELIDAAQQNVRLVPDGLVDYLRRLAVKVFASEGRGADDALFKSRGLRRLADLAQRLLDGSQFVLRLL